MGAWHVLVASSPWPLGGNQVPRAVFVVTERAVDPWDS